MCVCSVVLLLIVIVILSHLSTQALMLWKVSVALLALSLSGSAVSKTLVFIHCPAPGRRRAWAAVRSWQLLEPLLHD